MHPAPRSPARGRPRLERWAFAALLLGAAAAEPRPALGQGVPSTDAEALRLRQQREERERERRQNEPSVSLEAKGPHAAESTELPDEEPCFVIRELRLEGERAGRFGWAQEHLARYRGKCIGLKGIGLIADRLTAQLVRRGWVTTRIAIPEQRIAGGTVRFLLVPGVVRDIRLTGREKRGSWRSAIPSRRGDLIQVRDLDQGVEQLKRVPSQDADLQILPAEAVGESDILITLKRQKFWRASLTADDAGSEATGRRQGTATVSFDNPLALNDILSLTASHDLEFQARRHGTEGASFLYSVPWGYWTMTLDASANRYHQLVRGQNQAFHYRGENYAADLGVQRVIHRGQSSKTALQLTLGHRWARTFLEDTEIRVQRRNASSAELDLTHRAFMGVATVDATLGYRQGLPWLGHSNGGSASAGRYHIGTAELDVTVPRRWLHYSFRGRGQYTADRILVPEQFAIGNRYTVRGYDGEHPLTAERGWYVRNELAFPIWRTGQEIYAGADYGQVSGPSAAALLGTKLAGGVVGARGGYRFVQYEVFAGWPLLWPKGLRTERPAMGFMVTCQL